MKLSDKFSIFSGYAFKDFNTSQQGVPIIKIGNITADGRLNVDDVQYSTQTPNRKFYAQKGDFLIALSGATTGKSTIYSLKDNQYLVNQRVGIIRPITNNVRTELFFKYYLQYISNLVLHRAHGSAQPNISPKDLANFLLPCIDEKEQVEIGELLSNIEEGIRVKQEQLKALDELIQSRFTEMFGNTAKNITKKSLSVVCPIQAFGGDVESVDGKYWLLNLDAIESHTGYVLQEMYTSEIGSSTIKFSKDNVLYSKLRPYLNKVVIPNKSGYATSELVPFTPTKEINKYYFAYFLRSKAFVDYINANTNGARMPRASMDILKNFLIPVPPLPLQNQFAEFVQQVERAKEIVKIQIKDLQELLALKMDEYFK